MESMNVNFVIDSLIKDMQNTRDRMTMYGEYLSESSQLGLVDFVISSLDLMRDVANDESNTEYQTGFDTGMAKGLKQ